MNDTKIDRELEIDCEKLRGIRCVSLYGKFTTDDGTNGLVSYELRFLTGIVCIVVLVSKPLGARAAFHGGNTVSM